MSTSDDKALGSWYGMAVGDALGQSVKGLKPETVKQYFKTVDAYHDVKPHIGKGVKRYRMKGLYGVQTQAALAVSEVLLATKKPAPEAIADVLMRMGANGPEGYFGVFRRPEGCFYKTVESFLNRMDMAKSNEPYAFGATFSVALPIAAYMKRNSVTFRTQCVELARLFSIHPWEIVGTALTGFLVTRCLELQSASQPGALKHLFGDAVAFCEEVETLLQVEHGDAWHAVEKDPQAFSKTLRELETRYEPGQCDALGKWIAENASRFTGVDIVHPTQGHALTLLPFALLMLVDVPGGFGAVLTATLNYGREADKLGALAGAWAGALYGFDAIPDAWRSGLVNAKEIKARGEALARRKSWKGDKDLVAMELGLTNKEAEERRKFLPKETKKTAKKPAPLDDLWLGEEPRESISQLKEDPYKWRQFERDKAKKKRDRRRNPGFPE
ncbi:ADP-ribosylglycohydrolase family protein [Nitrospina gracilis]|uniref:ADP-ribosylglycohydrolase family protein n=1 Tax=Nitrospina gracilis TaxID=35801 RepID=UPI001F2D75C7|nr:ADP-ribosylglycohydrolase family protein [Nitrospina gracilis]MCF8721858.1 ADP-ribosylglycohydrolase [Nitrospina gracilis Nb-211]